MTTGNAPTTVYQTFYISTGRLNAMHTLRIRRDAIGLAPSIMPDFYVCNLAVDVEEAQRKGREYFDRFCDRVGGETDHWKLIFDPEPEYDISKRRGKLSARDTNNVQKIEAGIFPFGKHAGLKIVDAPDSYILYFADKVGKPDISEDPVITYLASACLGVALEKGLIAKRDAARAARRIEDVKSNHVGKVGQRMDFTGEIISAYDVNAKEREKHGTPSYWKIRIRCGDDILIYRGSSPLGEKGQTISFAATIKRHEDFEGVKSTAVLRPKIKEPA